MKCHFVLASVALVGLASASGSGSQHPLQSKSIWENCGEINGHALECARIDVPMDHFNQTSDKTFSIPLIRMLATNATANGGKTILLNPGGPGGSGISFLFRIGQQLNKVIGEGFHLLSFDPRGVNGSIPQAVCYIDSEQRSQKMTNLPWEVEYEAGEMFVEAENKANACAELMGEHGMYINTPQTASDMNSILKAIGQDELYYWGFSYGTTLGQTYAQMFPDRIGRLIIDGISNNDDWYNGFHDREWLTDTDKVVSGFADECFRAKDHCPLNGLSGVSLKSHFELRKLVWDLLETLEEEPIPVYVNISNYGSVTRRKVATNGIFPALYKPTGWPALAHTLAELIKGNPIPAYAFSDNWFANITRDESGDFVIRNDNWNSGLNSSLHGVKAIREYLLGIPRPSKLISKYSDADRLFNLASWSVPTTHDFHPQYYPNSPPIKTANPILILSTTYDPVCPLISAQKAQKSFEGSSLVEQKSYGHCTVSMPSVCMAKHVQRYLYEGHLPEPGATCEIDAEYFPGPEKKMKVLNQEDAELLTALEDLALVPIV
ncbi:Alpha/Beta hydrolase protein [Bisporella sp. PMI_857]|nr:Alpha/Beta hydrolase protein [Bisporella sp. PMI_857]